MQIPDFKRETQINHTYKIELELKNVSNGQKNALSRLFDILESEGIEVEIKYCEND